MSDLRDGDSTTDGNPRAVHARLRAAWRKVEGCLHPDAPTGCSRIIDAHSIQRKGPLHHLKDDTNKVYCFRAGSDAFFPGEPERVGWKEASTFRGLCHAHDQVFGPIERDPFTASVEQVFLLGYRATYLEIHEKRAAIEACDKLGPDFLATMYGVEYRATARHAIHVQQAGRRRGLVELTSMKSIYDRAWRQKRYDGIGSCIIAFDGALSVASAGVVSPDFTVAGDRLQELHLPNMHSLAFGTIATDRGGAIVFTWPREMNRMDRFVASLVGLPSADLPGALLLFMFSYVSNTFFSPAWWEALRPAAQARLSEAAKTPMQYYTPVKYRIGRVVDWRVTGIDSRP